LTVGKAPAADRAPEPAYNPVAEIHVIVNPASGSGRARKRWPGISATMMEFGLDHEVSFTSGPNDATRIARELAHAGTKTIVAVGGDGTVNEIINGMMEDNVPVNRDTKLLVLPCGTGKDLGRTLGTGHVDTAIKALVEGSVTRMDLGLITYTTSEGLQEPRYFANVADLGLGANVADRISRSSKKMGGLLTYLIAAVRTIIEFKARDISVEINGERVFHDSANMVVLANGQYFAGGMQVAPTASICDGLLEMYILADVGKRALLTSLLPRVYRGKHVGRNGVLHVRAGSVSIKSAAGILLEMDGEQIGSSPVSVEVVPRVLPVVIAEDRRKTMAGCDEGSH
jgi:diacylglycerol kinase (ATP)